MYRWLVYFLLLIPSTSYCQKVIPVELTFNKTVHLFFPDDVTYFDIGSDDVLGESKKTILKIAPKIEDFGETNLTVITANNICYTFLLKYSKDINMFNYFLNDTMGRKIEGKKVQVSNTGAEIKQEKQAKIEFEKDSGYISVCRSIVKISPSYWNIGASVKKIYLAINNIFVHEDKLYFVISIGNQSNINYDIDFLRMYVANKKKIKRSSIQEEIKDPVFTFNWIPEINAKTNDHFMVLVFDKFTIPDNKKLVFELYEKNGGRNISFDVTRDLIAGASAFK
jgi:conjugative transposon TraN protein